MAKLLPLFPLPLVVFPGSPLPLHIFEPRYREMVGEAAAAGSEFGIVRAFPEKDKSGVAQIGCTVTVESIPTKYPDGRFDVITRGRRRFKVTSLDNEKDYLRGDVEFFSDEMAEAPPPEIVRAAEEAYARVLAAVEREAAPGEPTQSPSFRFAEPIDDLDFRSVILQSTSETERLKLFTQFAGTWITRRQYTAQMQRKAPTNGSGHLGPGKH